MRRLAVIFLASVLAFSSCSKDDDDSKTDGQEQSTTTNDNGSAVDNNSNSENNSTSNGNSSSNNNSSSTEDNDWVGDGTYVDLGLPSGLLWATCNVGAESPEEIGGYFAWGEIKTNTNYSSSTYKFGSNYSKYNSTDGKTVLEPEDDAATVNLGAEWRIPTKEEWQELIDECAWEKGSSGYYVYKKNLTNKYDKDKSPHIFLPAGGYYSSTSIYDLSGGFYWAATRGGGYAYYMYSWIGWGNNPELSTKSRTYGLPIRPVKDK